MFQALAVSQQLNSLQTVLGAAVHEKPYGLLASSLGSEAPGLSSSAAMPLGVGQQLHLVG
jgi:hypothetical protein